MMDEYMKWVMGERRQLMEEYKKQGIILSYKVYVTQARSPSEPDIILTVEYKNWAAFDGLEDRQESASNRIWGSRDKANKASIAREEMREVIGGRLLQEMVAK
jgi:hypothetical protein